VEKGEEIPMKNKICTEVIHNNEAAVSRMLRKNVGDDVSIPMVFLFLGGFFFVVHFKCATGKRGGGGAYLLPHLLQQTSSN
jgi:hypothetical protein